MGQNIFNIYPNNNWGKWSHPTREDFEKWYQKYSPKFVSSEEFHNEIWPKKVISPEFRKINAEIDKYYGAIWDKVDNDVESIACAFGEYCMEEAIAYLIGIANYSFTKAVRILGILP